MKINRLIKTEKDARRALPERVARLADAAIQNNAKATRQEFLRMALDFTIFCYTQTHISRNLTM